MDIQELYVILKFDLTVVTQNYLYAKSQSIKI